MANIPLVANPILPPVPDEPNNLDDPELQKTFDALWKWIKDLSVQLKILLGSPQGSNSAITIPLVQPGMILPFGGVSGNIPAGYLVCDGSQVSQTQYAALFSAISSTWNIGGESAGNFRLPDLRGRGLLGAGTGTGLSPRAVAQLGGEETHLLTTPEIPSHSHALTDPGHGHALTDPGHHHTGVLHTGGSAFSGSTTPVTEFPSNLGTDAATTGISIANNATGISIANSGGGGAHNNMAPFAGVVWMIKF